MAIGKRISFDEETFAALDLYARDSMRSLQEVADEAFADLLKKHGRPTDLKDALRRSSRAVSANDNGAQATRPAKRRRRAYPNNRLIGPA